MSLDRLFGHRNKTSVEICVHFSSMSWSARRVLIFDCSHQLIFRKPSGKQLASVLRCNCSCRRLRYNSSRLRKSDFRQSTVRADKRSNVATRSPFDDVSQPTHLRQVSRNSWPFSPPNTKATSVTNLSCVHTSRTLYNCTTHGEMDIY